MKSTTKAAPPSSERNCKKHGRATHRENTDGRGRTYWRCHKCLREAQQRYDRRRHNKPVGTEPVGTGFRVRPATPCAICHMKAWRRRGRVWSCHECWRRKLVTRQCAAQQRKREASEAALEAKREKLPRWQRPIYRGDEQDEHIWRLFTLERLNMEMHEKGRPKSLPVQGRDWVMRAHVLRLITERDRLFEVFQTYGSMLAHGEDVGDPTRPPWWEAGKSSFTRR